MNEQNYEMIVYQPDESIRLEVRFQNETVWLTQQQICLLTGRTQSVISRHIKNIFKEGELDKKVVYAKYAYTTQHGFLKEKKQRKEIGLYNLDVIISVGYRVKSIHGTRFRQWAAGVLKEHILREFVLNQRIAHLEDKVKREGFDLALFDKYREGNRLEVKKASGGLPGSLWETYSSFANCNGGMIILGVEETSDGSWNTTHLQNKEKLLKSFWDTVNNRSKVSVNLLSEDSVTLYEVKGDIIIAIEVPKADRKHKPIFIDNDLFGGTFRRNHTGDYHCNPSEVKGMLRDQGESGMDSKLLTNMDLDVFYKDTVKSYRTRHNAVSPEHVWRNLDDDEYMLRIGAASKDDADGNLHPTVAGLLMFGEEYMIRHEFPEYFLDFREMRDPIIRWTDRIESSSGEWSGNLLDFFFLMERKLLFDLKRPFKLEGFTRIDETPVHKAIREALANCVSNADFNFQMGIVIKKDPDKIILENPRSIIAGKAQMLKGGVSKPRNTTIMKMLNLIKIGERAGSGVPNILHTWASNGWPEPKVEEEYDPDRTILTLPFGDKKVVIGNEKLAIGDEKVPIGDEKVPIEEKKLPIGDEKLPIEEIRTKMKGFNYAEPTKNSIEKIYTAFGKNQSFSSKDLIKLLQCTDRAVRFLVVKLRDELKVIVPVKGQGKGKYRFKNISELSDD